MADQAKQPDNLLKTLPIGGDAAPQRKKKTKKVLRRVRRKKKAAAPVVKSTAELPDVPDVPDVLTMPGTVDESAEPSEWDDLSSDAAEIDESDYPDTPVFQEHEEQAESVLIAESTKAELRALAAEPAEPAEEDRLSLLSPSPASDAEQSPAILPTPTGVGSPEAPESPVEVSQPREGQTLPDALETIPGTQEEPAVATKAVAPAKPAKDVNRKWDEFLMGLSDTTRTAVWELGATSITWFVTKSRGDLLPPKGRLNSGQLAEIETWLNQHGVFLAEKSAVGSALSRPGGLGNTIRRGGMRVHRQSHPVVKPGPQTAGQLRNARSAKRRFTM